MAGDVRHPIFARVYDRLSRMGAEQGEDEHRQELLVGLSGRVVEVGAGNGLNFSRYPPEVDELVAVEPEEYLRGRAQEEAAAAPVPVRVVDGMADRLPLEDGWADAVVLSLVLCSVPDQSRALAEAARVLKPGGELRFYEHVLARDPKLARLQNRVAPLWRRFGGGCNTNRETGAAIERAGFRIESCRRFPFSPSFITAPVSPHILGVARKP
jgi:ubiquinone/menaquinone biosynthesis C-methylase UbiE